MPMVSRYWRGCLIAATVVVLVWAAVSISHVFLPNLWLPAAGGSIAMKGQVEWVDPHIYDQQWFDAARAGRQDVTQALADAGFPVNTRNRSGYTALVLAAYHGHIEEVVTLLKAHANPCIPDTNGNNALMGALFKGDALMTNVLISLCPLDQTNNSGQTALAFAAMFSRLDSITDLVKRGADPAHTDSQGKTPLDIAVEQGNDKAAAALRSVVGVSASPNH